MESILKSISKNELLFLLENCKSSSELLRKVNLSTTGGNSRTLKKICKTYNLEKELNDLIIKGKNQLLKMLFSNHHI